VRSLYVDITVENQRKSQGLIWKVLSVGIPCLLMAISYGGVCLSSEMYVMGRLMFPRFAWHTHAISWMSRELWDKRELSTQCGEARIFVLNEVWSHWIRFGALACMGIMPSSCQILRCICFVWWCQVFQHGHRMGWVSLAPSF
jgi:hypothetical protein